MSNRRTIAACFSLCFVLVFLSWPGMAQAQYLRIRDICRVKGQEENTLHGVGLVVGLKGTGDTDRATLQALAKLLEAMGNPLGQSEKGQSPLSELKNIKNVATVMITATIPPEGVRQGEQLNCTVSALSAKSLEGGVLVLTPLVGPRPGNPRIYALAQGPLTLNESGPPTVGIVHDGCRLEEDFTYKFDDDGHVTLVIDRHHAGFPTAYEIQEALNGQGGKRRMLEGFGSKPDEAQQYVGEYRASHGSGQRTRTHPGSVLGTSRQVHCGDSRYPSRAPAS